MRSALISLLPVILTLILVTECNGQNSLATLPAGFAESIVATGLSSPTAIAFAPDGRLFICQQDGRLRVVKNGSLLSSPFITLSVDSTGERGLLGIAFDPNFSSNQYIYLYYTTSSSPIHNRVSRFVANGDVVRANSETVLLRLNNLSNAWNHNGGAIHFGRDGKLYIGVGENANPSNSQSLSNLLGKMLRINSDGSIPTDNPFYTTATGVNRSIWALGLRNPFTFAIQPGTGRIFINDVGQNSWEEINDGRAGANYGWPSTEGYTSNSAYRSPIYAYPYGRSDTNGCAIAGGAFYNPAVMQFPSLYQGNYFFADYCSGWIKRLNPARNNEVTTFASGISLPVDLKVGSDGSLYYLARGSSAVYRIRYTQNNAPTISSHPSSLTVSAGQTATFTATASGTEPLTYQWQRNGNDIAGADSSSYTIQSASSTDNGAQFRVIVTNAYGSIVSNSATLSVTSNKAPMASITSPAEGTLYSGGSVITFSGSGSDTESGDLPSSAFSWVVDFHHDTHTHPFLSRTGVKSGSFTIPTSGETSSNVWYRIYLTVRDPGGLTHTTYRDVFPRKVTITLQTDPSGLGLELDGQPVNTPYTFVGVVGITRSIGAISPQSSDGTTYQFSSWSDGGAETHNITTPASSTSYIAFYRETGSGVVGNGDGLHGTYYDNLDFTGSVVRRVDPTINFQWRESAPVPGIAADTFSVRWSGQVQAQYTEVYTFYTRSDDGVRLWVNGQLLINNWTDHAPVEDQGSIQLVAGQKYDIRLEYYEGYYGATCQLSWSSASTNQTIIPQSQLYSLTSSGGTGLPAPWSSQDIGPVSAAGSATHSSGTFTVRGGGTDIWDNRDEFHFAYHPLDGNGEITARIASLQNVHEWAKAGIMLRQSLSADSPHVSLFATGSHGLAFQRRLSFSGTSHHTQVGSASAPYWFRLVRSGNTITAYISNPGGTWSQAGSASIALPTRVYVGLAVTSHAGSTLCTATFDSVVVRD